jgi:hypothetical protein
VVKISALKFEVRHIRGTQNIVVDTLSRMFETPPVEEVSVSCGVTLTEFPLEFLDLKQLQFQDPALVDIESKLEGKRSRTSCCLRAFCVGALPIEGSSS